MDSFLKTIGNCKVSELLLHSAIVCLPIHQRTGKGRKGKVQEEESDEISIKIFHVLHENQIVKGLLKNHREGKDQMFFYWEDKPSAR